MYTEDFGRVAYMCFNTKGKKSKTPQSLLMPLSILDVEAERLNNKELQRLKEITASHSKIQIHLHPIKNVISLFIAELLYRIIQEKEANQKLFDFLVHAIQRLETVDEGVSNFHLTFMIKLSSYLGIYPNSDNYKAGQYFDLKNGVFTKGIPEQEKFLNKEDSIIFARLLKINFDNMSVFIFSREERVIIIRHIISYYRLHLSDFPELKSLDVLQSIFDN
jgi:DNA repair protein RecO (recombination protein O)